MRARAQRRARAARRRRPPSRRARAARRPGAAGRPGRRRCRCCRRRAARSAQRPSPGRGRRRRGAGRWPRGPGSGATASGTMSMPSTPMPGSARCSLIRPGPQPMSRVGPAQCASTRRVAGVGRGRPTGSSAAGAAARLETVHRARLPAQGGGEERDRERRGSRSALGRVIAALRRRTAAPLRGRTGCPARPPRPGRRRRRCRRRAARRCRRRSRPRRRRAASVSTYGRGGRHLHAGQRPRASAGSVTASTHQPPSSAGPSTASLPRPTRSATAASWSRGARAGCPCRSVRRARRRRAATSACAFASRSAKPSPRCGCTVQPASCRGQLGRPDGAGQVAGQRDVAAASGRTPRRTRASVSSSAAAASSAAALVPTCGAEPGLDLPGAPAPWPSPGRRAASRRAPGRSPGRRARVPRTEPDTLDRVPCGARVVGDVVLGDPPAGAQSPSAAARRGSRTAGPRTSEREQGRRGGTPASARCRAPAGRSGGAATTAPARCRRGRARATRRGTPAGGGRPPGPRGRPATSVEQRQQVGGVERAVAVHHRDVARAVGRLDPGVHGGAVPGPRLAHDARAERAARPRRCRRSSRCRPRSPRSRRGCVGSRPRSAGPSSRQGSTRSQTAGMPSSVGGAPRRPRAAGTVTKPCPYPRRMPTTLPAPPDPARPAATWGLGGRRGADRCWRWRCPRATGLERAASTRSRRCTPSGTRASGWGTLPAVALGGARAAARRPARRAAHLAAAAARGVPRRPGLDAGAGVRRRLARASSQILGDPLRVPPHRPAYDGPARDAAGVRQPHPATTRRRATGRCTSPATRRVRCCSSWCSTGCGLGSGFAAGLVVTVLAATTAVGGAGDRCGRSAPSSWPAAPRRSWCSARPRSGSAVSADAMFAAFARLGHSPAWRCGATRRSVRRGRCSRGCCWATR